MEIEGGKERIKGKKGKERRGGRVKVSFNI